MTRVVCGLLFAAIVCPCGAKATAQTDSSKPRSGVQSRYAAGDQTTLEIPPRVVSPPTPAPEASAPASDELNPNDLQDVKERADESSSQALPYLGASIQYIEANDLSGKEVRGLEVVAVDPASPAEKAGLHGRGNLTKLGASGATAGALMPPLDLIMLPLLKKAGELGDDGDLIIAIDDNRVSDENDLKTALASLKPSDTIYFTIVRQHQAGAHETLKIPVKVGASRPSNGMAAFGSK